MSQEEALKEFNEDYFPDNPEITQLVTADVIPSSYRVIPAQLNAEAIEILHLISSQGGVKKWLSATDEF